MINQIEFALSLDECEDPKARTRIYFIQCQTTKRIKIGLATDIPVRLAVIQALCPTQLILLTSIQGSHWAEAELHRRFADARLHGEWFSPVPELLCLIGEKMEKKDQRASDQIPRLETPLKGDAGPLRDLMVATGLNERACKRAIDAGELPGYKYGQHYVVPEAELTAWLHGKWSRR